MRHIYTDQKKSVSMQQGNSLITFQFQNEIIIKKVDFFFR